MKWIGWIGLKSLLRGYLAQKVALDGNKPYPPYPSEAFTPYKNVDRVRQKKAKKRVF